MSDNDNKDNTNNAGNADQAPEKETPLFTIGDRNFNKDDAVNKITNADSFIEQLKAEGKLKDDELIQLRAQIDQSTKLDDALARINSKGTGETPSQEASTNAIDLEAFKKEILGSFNESLTAKEKLGLTQKNQESSISAAQAVYGDQYESKLREKAKQLGMSDADIITEAGANPEKFKALFGLNRQTNTTPTPRFNTKGSPSEGGPQFKLGGFSAKEQVQNMKDTLASFAKARGIDPELMNKF
jgi:hypothetical protein